MKKKKKPTYATLARKLRKKIAEEEKFVALTRRVISELRMKVEALESARANDEHVKKWKFACEEIRNLTRQIEQLQRDLVIALSK